MKNRKRKSVANKQAIKQGQKPLSNKDQKTLNRYQHSEEIKVFEKKMQAFRLSPD